MQRSPHEYRRALSFSYGALAVVGLAIAAALSVGLWNSRHMKFVGDIGGVLAHRGVGNYTLSMSHFFDLTGPSFAALRLPATLAAIALASGTDRSAGAASAPQTVWRAILTLALISTVF